MIEEILPSAISAVDVFGDLLDDKLFAEEKAVLARTVGKRRRDFATGRACARRALVRLGIAPGPIPVGPGREPVWPDGIVGSITHCDGYRAAAVASDKEILAIGIDAEPNEPLPPGVIDLVADPREQAWITKLAAVEPTVCWDRLLFSAKESLYKAWFPLTRRWLDFKEATVTMNDCDFMARLLVAGPTHRHGATAHFRGRWMVRQGVVVTAICVPRNDEPT